MKKFNIIFTVNEKEDEYLDDYDEFDSDDEDYETENEDDEVSDSEEEEEEDEEEEEEEEVNKKINKKNCKEVVEEIINKIKLMEDNGINDETVKNDDILKQLNSIKKKYNNPLILKCINECKIEIKKEKEKCERKQQKQRERNERIFRKIIKNKNMMNDNQYFVKLDIEEQKK